MCHHKSWGWKMSNYRIEVEGGNHQLLTSENSSSEKSCRVKMCQWNTLACLPGHCGKKKPVKSSVEQPNVRAGIKVMVALPGALVFADNYKIKKKKGNRGLESRNDLFTYELGLLILASSKEFADGIQTSPQDAIPWGSLSYLFDDEIIELSITPNRADALSMRGVAHEVAAIYDKRQSL